MDPLLDLGMPAMAANPAALDMQQYHPTSTSWEEDILGKQTNFVITIFGKKLLVVISQCGSIGSWVEASVDGEDLNNGGLNGDGGEEEDDSTNPLTNLMSSDSITYETQVLFGARGSQGNEYQRVYARRLIEIIHKTNTNLSSLVLGIAMKDSSPKVFKLCMNAIQKRIE